MLPSSSQLKATLWESRTRRLDTCGQIEIGCVPKWALSRMRTSWRWLLKEMELWNAYCVSKAYTHIHLPLTPLYLREWSGRKGNAFHHFRITEREKIFVLLFLRDWLPLYACILGVVTVCLIWVETASVYLIPLSRTQYRSKMGNSFETSRSGGRKIVKKVGGSRHFVLQQIQIKSNIEGQIQSALSYVKSHLKVALTPASKTSVYAKG